VPAITILNQNMALCMFTSQTHSAATPLNSDAYILRGCGIPLLVFVPGQRAPPGKLGIKIPIQRFLNEPTLATKAPVLDQFIQHIVHVSINQARKRHPSNGDHLHRFCLRQMK
jgi:hypothetical protein